ncbi:phosphonate transport system substrate-binding protein [Variovorax sp. SG517]|uniref:phosphate/phosphite/phosphonate ABC transporter substrate-binding protein n=1 Tax=Variovorax sp. SG517 TaxID=2587117 RepID=UPI00159DE284|nr:phosphonate transport system substrate-binding protein [Variovorax sp. SG517]
MRRRDFLIGAGAAGWTSVWAQGTLQAPKPPGSQPATRLAFGLISPRDPEVMLKNWNPFLDRMALATGSSMDRRVFGTADEIVKEFAAGRMDVAWLGNAAALDVVEMGAGSVFATMVNQGKTSYRSILIVPRDSRLRDLDDLLRTAPQLRFGDGDEKSASGHLVPMYFAFVKKGVNDPARLFKEVRRASHEANLLAVARGEVDVATNNTSELDNLRARSPAEAAKIRVIWESPDIPESPMVWRTELPQQLKQKIASFTYGFGTRDAEEKKILWDINRLTGWRQSSNRQLITIANLEMFKASQQIMRDPGLSEAQRLQQVGAVMQRGSKLEQLLRSAG